MAASGTEDDGSEQSLGEVLDQVEQHAGERHRVTVGGLAETIGARSFAPLILLAGLVMMTPLIGDIPGVPVLMGLLVILVLVQMLMRRRHLWLPGWLERRAVDADRVARTVRRLRRPASWLDRWSHRRWTWALRGAGLMALSVVCIVVSAATPVMEVVPFSANLAGAVVTAFGLALVSQDGLLAVLAMALAAAAGVLLGWYML